MICLFVPKKPASDSILKELAMKFETSGFFSGFFFFFSSIKRPLSVVIYLILGYLVLSFNPGPIMWWIDKTYHNEALCPDPYGVCEEFYSKPENQ